MPGLLVFLASERNDNENRSWCFLGDMFFGNIATLASVVLGANSFNLFWKSAHRHNIRVVGFPPLPSRLYNRLASDTPIAERQSLDTPDLLFVY